MQTEVGRLIALVERERASLLDLVEPLDETQCAFRPTLAQWNVVEVLEHLYLAEIGGIAKIWAALLDVRAGRPWGGAMPHKGRSIEDVIDRTWKAKEVAPPVATPHIGGPKAAWVSALRSLTSPLRDLAGELQDEELDQVVFPHALSGPLDARQRLEFLRFHMERHSAQIHRIRTHAEFPRTA